MFGVGNLDIYISITASTGINILDDQLVEFTQEL